jgi:argininosuccinate lyase
MVNTRERLKGKESEAMLKYIDRPALSPESVRLMFTDMIEVDIAHAIMLGKTGIVDADKAKKIVNEL